MRPPNAKNRINDTVVIDGIIITPNQDPDCLTLVQYDSGTEAWDAVHICDWPKLRNAIDRFQTKRPVEDITPEG